MVNFEKIFSGESPIATMYAVELYSAIKENADENGEFVASVSEILRISGLKEGAYYRALKALVDGGFISRKQINKGRNGFGGNTYKVLKSLPAGEEEQLPRSNRKPVRSGDLPLGYTGSKPPRRHLRRDHASSLAASTEIRLSVVLRAATTRKKI
jgi:hypothetical protein